VKEQVKSGFLIAGKLVAAICIAAVFLSGCALVQEAATSSEIVIGWLLIVLSVVVMAITVRFWAAGFVGFIAYAALRLFGGTLFSSSLRASPLHMLSVAASLLAMSLLCIRFASGTPRITQTDRASLVLAAICALLSLPLMDSYRSVAVLNVGNVVLGLSWLAVPSLTSDSAIGSQDSGSRVADENRRFHVLTTAQLAILGRYASNLVRDGLLSTAAGLYRYRWA